MSTPVAVIAVLALWIFLSAAIILAFKSRRAAFVAAPAFVALTGGLSLYHVGIPGSGDTSAIQRWRAAQTGAANSASGSLCERVLAEAQRGRLILDRSQQGRVVVNRNLWGQLPAEVQQAITSCLDPSTPGTSRPPVEIVER
jgi:hypothetical protein